MKTVKQISVALIILVLVGLAAFRLNSNKEKIKTYMKFFFENFMRKGIVEIDESIYQRNYCKYEYYPRH